MGAMAATAALNSRGVLGCLPRLARRHQTSLVERQLTLFAHLLSGHVHIHLLPARGTVAITALLANWVNKGGLEVFVNCLVGFFLALPQRPTTRHQALEVAEPTLALAPQLSPARAPQLLCLAVPFAPLSRPLAATSLPAASQPQCLVPAVL